MFTGIVTDMGVIKEIDTLDQGVRLKIMTQYNVDKIDLGASIACMGVCLTVVEKYQTQDGLNFFSAEVWEEALRLTNISTWKVGTKINLERSLKLGDEMGGHLVSGHVDGLAEVINRIDEGEAVRFYIKVPEKFSPFIAEKGSVALNGTSLTVNSVENNIFDVLIIRHTLEVTIWGQLQIGDMLNLEIDQLARYAARLTGFVSR